uniref:hypothetical protein n=1 Tax=Paraburkholderia franconis TaxID=2654983 RepID=UPI001D12837C|nr:hypothetical protein [Paraburkholderia franconis]
MSHAEMKYSGIDLHSNNAMVAVIDDEDRVLYCKRLANDLQLIVAALVPHQDELQGIVVEATFNWYWLVDGLIAAGFAVHLANTSAIKQYEGLNVRLVDRCSLQAAVQDGICERGTPHRARRSSIARSLPQAATACAAADLAHPQH